MPPKQNIKKLQALVDSDSQSYGSEGLKRKAIERYKTRGGRKRNNKTGAMESNTESNNSDSKSSGDEDEEAAEIWSRPKTKEEIAKEEEEAKKREKEKKKEEASRKKQEAEEANEVSKQISLATASHLDISKSQNVPEDSDCSTPRARAVDPSFKEQNSLFIRADVKYNPVKKKHYSPPMIKEYDPYEDNAKTRAVRRREELKKHDQYIEVDKSQYPEDPTPWKGKPSDFFLMHVPRKGTHKVLNNSQKEFILIYYPDTIVDHVSLMEFLYRQSKAHEDKEKNMELEKQGLIILGKKKKKGQFGKATPAFVHELKHINEEQKHIKRDASEKPISFEALLEGGGSKQLLSLTDQINHLTGGAANRFIEATLEEEQHSRQVSPNTGHCTHCHHNNDDYLHKNAAQVQNINKQVDQQRQQILQQICEAKRRQAKMEAEEARRLKDEAIRLSQQAKILELEAQRPLLEAQRLDAEIRLMEQQFGKIFGQGGILGSGGLRSATTLGSGSGGGGLDNIYGEGRSSSKAFGGGGYDLDQFMVNARDQVQQRKEQLIDEARRARFEIAKLQQQTLNLHNDMGREPQRNLSMYDTRPPQQKQENWFDQFATQTRGESTFIPSQNSIAARQAIAQANSKAAIERAKREKMEREIHYKEQERQRMLILKQQEAMQREKDRIEQAQLIKETKERLQREMELEKKKKGKKEIEPTYEDSYYTETQYDKESEEASDEEEDEVSENPEEEEIPEPVTRKPRNNDEYDDEHQQEQEEEKRQASPVQYKYVPKAKPKEKLPEFKKEKSPEKVVIEKRKRRERAVEKSVSEMSVQEIQYKKYREKEDLRKRQGSPRRERGERAERAERPGRSPPKAIKREKPSEQLPELDPYLDAADLELAKAKRKFEKAQQVQQEAHEKKQKLINKHNEEVALAQEEAKKYFEEQKRKHADDIKAGLSKKKATPNNQQQSEDCQGLLKAFKAYLFRVGEEQDKLKRRYFNRNICAEFLTPILNGQVVKEFSDDYNSNIKAYILSDNFAGGHEEYFYKWRHLYLYETYAFLMNSRWSKFTGSDIDLKNQIKSAQKEKSMCWRGYFQFKQTEGKFTTLKMLHDPPSTGIYAGYEKGKNWSKIYDEPERFEGANFKLSHCREEDLIVISKFRINLEGQDDLKMVQGGTKFLKEVLTKQGVMLGYIAKCESKINSYVEVIVDSKYSNYFQNLADEPETGTNVFMRYCYFFESVLTGQREFKALKAIEFTRLCPVLTYPSLALEFRDKILDDYAGAVSSCFEDLDAGPVMCPVELEDGDKAQSQMNNYLIKNHKNFNKSQARVLEQIIEMPKDDILLIQGPPGTGKTHTIIGIISMLMSSTLANSKQKIMVCAPSNAAIDQIIMRIISSGLIGMIGLKRTKRVDKKAEEKKNKDDTDSSSEEEFNNQDLTQTLIRITSAEYNTESDIKKYTLEQRIIKKLCIEKFGELKKAIKQIKELIDEMNDYDAWDDNQDFPFVNKVKFKNYTKMIKDAYLKRVENWGDPNLSRQLQMQAMKNQLQIHEKELGDFKTGQNVEQGNMEWKDAEKLIIAEAKIICCTLSMAGSSKLEPFVNNFEYLIIDEACQCTEPSVLIPFALAPKRVILVGDQKQLPATTFSGNSEKTGFCRSLFERLLDSGYDKTMLTIQFRMHPKIRAFPSEQFYGGAITDHQSIGLRSAPLTISNLARVFPQRMIFFDIVESEEAFDNKSKCNYEEADFTKILVEFIARKMSLQGTLKYVQGQIGVISPYKAQVRQLYSRIERLCADQGCSIGQTVEVNTVDAFQGSEKDIIIFNCVRSNYENQLEKSLGFLLDERRLNVAITRPKYFLMIVGNAKTLQKSLVWEDMIEYCKAQGSYIRINDASQFETMADFKKYILPQFMI